MVKKNPVAGIGAPPQGSYSEAIFEGELDVAGALRAVQQPQLAPDAVVRRVQNRGVCQVNELRAEIEALPLGDPKILRQIEIESGQARPSYSADPATTERAIGGLRKASGAVPLKTISHGRALLAQYIRGRDAVRTRAAG